MDVASTTLFATGISGLVGRALLARLAPRRVPDGKGARPARILGLSRNVTTVPAANVELVRGDLLKPQGWESKLAEAGVVLHMAAATGKLRPDEYQRVNVEGTRAVIEACKRAGVRRLCYVSTIAVRYPELDRYPYGRSKRDAEELVRGSGLDWSIVRPTIVLGRRSALWDALRSLASAAVVPVFGAGRVRVQPILVDDLGNALADWIFDESLEGQELELGGPEVLTMEELLIRIRAVVRPGAAPRAVHLPLRPLMAVLRALEGPLLPLLPLTAGQLYAFAHDSTAAPNVLLERHRGGMRDVAAMLAELTGG
jgi:NADH dehydrogenase